MLPAGRTDKPLNPASTMKLVTTYAALESEISMDGEMLTRTKTTNDGDRKALTAKIKIDTGKWQTMNCIRSTLNQSGLDFSLPVTGALGGSRVDWNLVDGGRTRAGVGR